MDYLRIKGVSRRLPEGQSRNSLQKSNCTTICIEEITWCGTRELQYVSTFSGLTDWGYTGHSQSRFFGKHLNEFGLNYKLSRAKSRLAGNGRMYDPVLGRMLSPDNYVQDATGTQNYNRYSYCLNNPISYVDPDGNNPLIAIMIFSAFTNVAMNSDNINNFWDGLGYAAVGAASGAAGYGAGAGIAGMFATGSSGFIFGAAAGAAGGAAGGFTGGFGNTLVGGGSFADALNNGFRQGVFGAIVGGVVGGVVSGVDAVKHNENFWTGKYDAGEFYMTSDGHPVPKEYFDKLEAKVNSGTAKQWQQRLYDRISHRINNSIGFDDRYGVVPTSRDIPIDAFGKGDINIQYRGSVPEGTTVNLTIGKDVYTIPSGFNNQFIKLPSHGLVRNIFVGFQGMPFNIQTVPYEIFIRPTFDTRILVNFFY